MNFPAFQRWDSGYDPDNVRRVREDFGEIKLEDQPNPFVYYCGTAIERTATPDKAAWRIMRRVVLSDGTIRTDFAGDGYFTNIWDNRTSLFPPYTPPSPAPDPFPGAFVGKHKFFEIEAVDPDTDELIIEETVPSGKMWFLERVEFSGNQFAKYELKVDSDFMDRKHTWLSGELSGRFELSSEYVGGLRVDASKIVRLVVRHSRIGQGKFNARMQYLEVSVP